MMVALTVFVISLLLIIALFAVRAYEERRGEKLAPAARMRADETALEIKDWVVHTRDHLEALPPEVAHLSMRIAHAGALGAAAAARSLENQAHRFADFVSSKRNFERRETKSEFLKQVTEYKSPAAQEFEEETTE